MMKQQTEPWITSDSYLYKFRTFGFSEDYKSFSNIRIKIQHQIKSAKTEYISNQIEEDKDKKTRKSGNI